MNNNIMSPNFRILRRAATYQVRKTALESIRKTVSSYVSAPVSVRKTEPEAVITPLGKFLRKTYYYAMYGSVMCLFLLPFSEPVALVSFGACFTVGFTAAVLTNIMGIGFSTSEKTKEPEMKIVGS